jgi:hypothetical protein
MARIQTSLPITAARPVQGWATWLWFRWISLMVKEKLVIVQPLSCQCDMLVIFFSKYICSKNKASESCNVMLLSEAVETYKAVCDQN